MDDSEDAIEALICGSERPCASGTDAVTSLILVDHLRPKLQLVVLVIVCSRIHTPPAATHTCISPAAHSRF